jgi:FKBP-type peptidyl-prolyl cis-trans isomerase 2
MIKNGKKVKVHYTGKFKSGEVFDTSEGREPISFTVGQGMMIKGFEEGVMGMSEGEKKTVEIQPADAYGEINPQLISDVELSKLPEGVEVGSGLQATSPDGTVVNVTVMDLLEDKAVIHMDHPLAGKILVFDLEVVEVV